MNDRDDSLNVTAVAAMPRDLALIKMENESIMAMATMPNNRRDHKAIRAEMIEQLEAYPAFARTAVYSKPVGTVTVVTCKCGNIYEESSGSISACPKCDQIAVKATKKKKKFAKGLSIRAAEAIAELYGYNRIRVDVTDIDADHVRIEATFTDLQKGRSYSDSGILSKVYRGRDGDVRRIPDDRFYNITCKAEASKRVREVIMRCVPPGLRAELQDVAEQRMREALSEHTIERVIETFAEFRVSREDLERIVGKTVGAGWTEEDRADLVAAYNALKTGECTRDELMADLEEQAAAKAPAGGGKRVSDLNDKIGTKADAPKTNGSHTTTPTQAAPTAAAQQETQPAQGTGGATNVGTQPTPEASSTKPAQPAAAPTPTQAERPQPTPELVPNQAAHDDLAQCRAVAHVDACERKHGAQCRTPEEFDAWATACDMRRETIRDAYRTGAAV